MNWQGLNGRGTDAIRRIDCTWRGLGVSRTVRREMLSELNAYLDAASADGNRGLGLIGPDPVSFARSWALSRGEVRGRWRVGLVTIAVLLGALPGAVFGLFIAYGTSSVAFADLVGADDGYLDLPGWLLFGLYAVGGLLARAGAVLAVLAVLAVAAALRSVDDPHRRRTVRLLAATLPATTLLGIVAAVTYGDQLQFSTAPPTPEIEALLVVALTALGAALTRLLVRWHAEPAGELA